MGHFTEWVGYIASALIIWSFLLKEMRSLRIVNSLGCAVFVVYGVLLGFSWPIIITNVFILAVNIYYLTTTKAT